MEIYSIEIRYHWFQQGGTRENGLVHVKQLPYLSVVQSLEGSYGIRMGAGTEYFTGEGGLFIAPAFQTQTVTHLVNPETGNMTMRYAFLDAVINQRYRLDDLYDFPLIPGPETTALLNGALEWLSRAENLCDRMCCLYTMVKHLLSVGQEKPVQEPAVYTLIQWIRQHYPEHITVADMARVAQMSESNLYAVFRRATGQSPVQYLNEYRLSQAGARLLESKTSVAEIARAVGIPDQFYFSKLFRERYCVSPRQYRKKSVFSSE